VIQRNTILIDQYLKDSIDINFKDEASGDTLLHAAIRNANPQLVKHLLELGIDEEIENNDRQTAGDLITDMIDKGDYMAPNQEHQAQLDADPYYTWLRENLENLMKCGLMLGAENAYSFDGYDSPTI